MNVSVIGLPGRLMVQVHTALEAYAPLVITPEGSDSRAPPEHGAPLDAALGTAIVGPRVDGLCKSISSYHDVHI